jgi:hypothetical protein
MSLQVPLMLQNQKAHVSICNTLGLQGYNSINMHMWKTQLADQWDNLLQEVKIAIIGKYTNLSDSYLSVIKALQHACLAVRRRLKLLWVEAGNIEEQVSLAFFLVRCQHCLFALLSASVAIMVRLALSMAFEIFDTTKFTSSHTPNTRPIAVLIMRAFFSSPVSIQAKVWFASVVESSESHIIVVTQLL